MTINDKNYLKDLIKYQKNLIDTKSDQEKYLFLMKMGGISIGSRKISNSYLAYSKALQYAETNKQKHEAYMAIGRIHFLLEDYGNSLKSYERSLDYAETDQENYIIHLCIGNCHYELKQYKLALESLLKSYQFVEKFKNEDNNKFIILFNISIVYRKIKCFVEALNTTKDAFKFAQSNEERYKSNLGIAYCYSGMNENDHALYEYYKTYRYVNNEQEEAEVLLNIASSWHSLNRFDFALNIYKEVLTKAKTDSQRYVCHVNIGSLLMQKEGNLTKDGEAIHQYHEALKFATPNQKKWLLNEIGRWYFLDEQFNTAFRFFKESASQFDLINLLPKTIDKSIQFNNNLMPIIEFDQNYTNIVKEITDSDLPSCAEFYFITCQIVALLSVRSPCETKIAHYTSINNAGFLLNPNGTFRLSSISQMNDPSEGKSLLSYFKATCWDNITPHEIKQQAFVSCFSFNHNHLNQFRLYGKSNNQEATGLSLVIKREDYFNQDEIRINTYEKKIEQFYDRNNVIENNKQDVIENNKEDLEPEKYHLFRCIYIDPLSSVFDTTISITLAQREKYTFAYNDESDCYDAYAEELTQKTRNVFNKLKELKAIYDRNNGNEDMLELLELLSLPLKYLVKHIAFKEEQECRCFDLKAINDPIVKNDAARFPFPNTSYFIENTSIAQAVSKIWLGPESNELPAIKEFLAHHELNDIKVEKSKLPIRNKRN